MTEETFEPVRPPLPPACPRCTRPTRGLPFCDCGFDLYHGSAKRKLNGKCLYCPYNGKLSAEHVFGKWLARRYRKPALERLHHLRRPVKAAFFSEPTIHEMAEDIRTGLLYDDVVYNVCEKCNNGWMSQVHLAASPLIERLADGSWPQFSPIEQAALIRWAAMISLNLESRSRIKSTAEHQIAKVASGSSSSGWRVSIARMLDDTEAGNSFFRHIQFPIMAIDKPHSATSAWFCVENVAFHVFGTWDDRVDEVLQMMCSVPKQFLPRRIYPDYEPARAENSRKITGWQLYAMQQALTGG